MDTKLLNLLMAFAIGGLLVAYLHATSKVTELEQDKEDLSYQLKDTQDSLRVLEERFRNHEEYHRKNKTSWLSMLWRAVIHFFL